MGRSAIKSAPLLVLAALPLWAADESVRDVRPQTPNLEAIQPLSPLSLPLSAPGVAPQILATGETPSLPPSPVVEPTAFAAPAQAAPGVQASAAQAQADQPVEQLTAAGSARFDRAAPIAQAESLVPWRFAAAPESYRREVAERSLPKADLVKVLSNEGSSGVVFEGRLAGKTVAVKTYGSEANENWPETLKYFRNEVVMARAMSRVLGPKGLAPKVYGEVDIGERGNPSWAMEKIDGADPHRLTAAQARGLITPGTLRQAAEGIRLLREAGLGGGDSPQPMILLKDQAIHGVSRKAGDVVFMDAGGLTRNKSIWKTPEDEASDLAWIRLRADELYAVDPTARLENAPELSYPQRMELLDRARQLARATLASAPVKQAPSADPGFDEFLKNETGFGEAALLKQGVPPGQIQQLRQAYLRERPPPATDFPDGPPPPAASALSAKPSGTLKIREAGKDRLVPVALARKPDAMEATFLGVDGQGQGVAVKTSRYVSVEGKPEAEQQKALRAEAAMLREAARARLPVNVSVPAVLGLGYMDETLAARIYGAPGRVPVLLIKRAAGVTIERWLNSGRNLNGADLAALVDAVRRLHAAGIAHGDLNIGNILVSEDGANGRQSFVLLDFGASRRKDALDPSQWAALAAEDLRELSQIEGFFRRKGRLVKRPSSL